MTTFQDIIDVGEENKKLPCRNKSLAVADGSGDNDRVAKVWNNKVLGDSKQNISGKKTLRVWRNQIWKRIQNGFTFMPLKKIKMKN